MLIHLRLLCWPSGNRRDGTRLALVLASKATRLCHLAKFAAIYSTSGASEIIFMKFLARSSRTTGRKILYLTGFITSVKMTARCDRNGWLCPIVTTNFFGCANDGRLYARHPFFTRPARDGFLDEHDNDVADGCVFTLGTNPNTLMTEHGERTAVVSNIQVGRILIIWFLPTFWGAMRALSPGFRLSWVRPKWASRSCLLRLLPSFPRETGRSGPSEAAPLKPQGCSTPNVLVFDFGCTFDDAKTLSPTLNCVCSHREARYFLTYGWFSSEPGV